MACHHGTTRFPETKPQTTYQSRLKRKTSAAELFSPVCLETRSQRMLLLTPKRRVRFHRVCLVPTPPVSDPLAWTVRSVLVSFSQNEQLLVGAEPVETYKREGDWHVL